MDRYEREMDRIIREDLSEVLQDYDNPYVYRETYASILAQLIMNGAKIERG